MITVKKVTDIDQTRLGPRARAETEGFKSEMALRMWEVFEDGRFLGIFGLTHGSLTTGMQVWFAAASDFHPTHTTLRKFRKLLRRVGKVCGGFSALVQDDFTSGLRFARFFGLKPRGQLLNWRAFSWQPQAD